MIHVSDLTAMDRCARLSMLQRSHPASIPTAASRESFKNLLREGWNLSDLPGGKPYDTPQQSLEILQKNKGGLSLRFEYRGVRTKIPALVQYKDGFKAYYPILAMSPRDHMLPQMMLDQYICKQCGVNIVSHEIIYLNKEYVRKPELHPEELLLSSQSLKRSKGGFYPETIDEMIAQDSAETDFEEWIDEAHELFDAQDLPEPVRSRTCVGKRKCVYFEECFHEDELSADSIRHLSSSQHKLEMEEKGIDSLSQADPDLLEGLPMQYAQIQADRHHGVFMDKPALQNWMKSIQYPLTYMDFEWDTYSIPPYEGMKPFEVLCFQYSLHIQNEEDTPPEQIEHKNFFEDGDCRRSFIESLLFDLPQQGSIMVFNLEGGEKLRLKQLARQFPEYAQQIESVIARLVDLAAPFENGFYYQIEQKGRFSLKTLLPLFTEQNFYKQLEVSNGLEAVEAYRKCLKETDPEIKNTIANQISDYCAMDTMAEAKLFAGLKARVNSPSL